jgi:hypothetical protein
MRKCKRISVSILFVFLLVALAGVILAAEKIKIIGVVTEDGLIIDKNGGIYEIGENDNFEAVSEKTDVKVEVTGMVEEDGGGNKIIMIDSFKVLD